MSCWLQILKNFLNTQLPELCLKMIVEHRIMLELTRTIARTAVKIQHDTIFQVLLCLMIYIRVREVVEYRRVFVFRELTFFDIWLSSISLLDIFFDIFLNTPRRLLWINCICGRGCFYRAEWDLQHFLFKIKRFQILVLRK